MGLSTDLIAQFVKATKDDTAPKKETTVYGTVVKDQNGEMRVQFDGSDTATPVSSTVDLNDGDRVVVMIKNHTATVTGNASDPAAGNKQVGVVRESVEALGVIVADKVSTKELEAERAEINELIAKRATVDQLTAARAEIDELIAKKASVEQLEAEKATINELIAKKLSVEDFNAEKATINELIAKRATVDQLTAARAEIDELIAKKVSTETLEAEKATINELIAKKIDADSADIKYAQVDFSNIDMAFIKTFFSESGVIQDVYSENATITGYLVGVTIKGDLIEANTLKADKLVVLGKDGLYYKLNVEAGVITSSEEAEAALQNGLHGDAIIAKTITAEKVSVSDLVAFGADIGGFHIADDAIYSGVKKSLDNTTNGLFLDKYGQMALGDSSRYLKFQKASENLCVEVVGMYSNVTVSNGVVTQIDADDHERILLKLQVYVGWTYVRQIAYVDNLSSPGVVAFTFTKDDSFDRIAFGLNGKSRDTLSYVDVSHLVDGDTYTISANFTNITQGSVSWRDVMINEGSEALPYEPYGRPSSLEISADMVSFGGTPVSQLADDIDAARSEASQAAESLRSDTNQIKQYFQYDKNVGVTIRGSAETSNNLIPFPYYDGTTKEHNGITFTVNADGGIHAVGTNATTEEAIFYLSRNIQFASENVYAMNSPQTVDEKTFQQCQHMSSGTFPVYVRVSAGSTVDKTFYPMINEGSEALPYERYVRPTTQYLRLDNDEFKIMDGENVVQHFDAYGNAVIPSLKVETQLDLLGLIFTKDEDGTINCIYRGGNA